MKKIFQILLLIILMFTLLLTGCQKKVTEVDEGETKIYEEEKETVTPLFYKITSNETDATIYLLGSIHAADDSIYPLNDAIMSSYNESDYLAVEVDITDIDYELQLEITEKMLCEEGIKIKDYLGDELYNKMVKLLKEKNSYNFLLDEYKPVFIVSNLENLIIKDAGMDSIYGIDMYFLNLAKENEKEILEIETAELQYDLLLNCPDELFQMMIGDCVNDYDKSVLEMKILYEAWKQGNTVALEKSTYEFDEGELTEEEIEISNDYIQTLIVDRNYGMVSALEKYMYEDKNVFCVVGVGHVIGDEGIVTLMEQKGYKVEKVN